MQKPKVNVIVVLLAGLLTVSAIGRSSASAATFTPPDLQRLDTALAELEEQNSRNAPKSVSATITNMFAEKSLSIGRSLLVPSTGGAGEGLSAEEREYFKSRPAEFAARVFGQELGLDRIDRMRRIFRARFSSGDSSVRREAIWWFLAIIRDRPATSEVEALVKSSNPELRLEAATQLTFVGNSAGRVVLEEALASKDEGRAMECAVALSRVKNEKARSKLLEIVRSPKTERLRRSNALSALSAYPDGEVIKLLIDQLASFDTDAVQSAVSALSKVEIAFDDTLVQKLFGVIENQRINPIHRRIASQMIFSRPMPSARERVVSYRTSEDSVLKYVMLLGLMKEGKKSDASLVASYLGDSEPAVRNQAEYALQRITGVKLGDPQREGIDSVVSKRKDWWADHKDDPEYR